MAVVQLRCCFCYLILATSENLEFRAYGDEMRLGIEVGRVGKVYRQGDQVVGTLEISTSVEEKHEGVKLSLDGFAKISRLPNQNLTAGDRLESKSSGQVSIPVLGYACQLLQPGRLPTGNTRLRFSIPLKPADKAAGSDHALPETYNGVRINVRYVLLAEIKRGLLRKNVRELQEIYVVTAERRELSPEPKPFRMSPETIGKADPSVVASQIKHFHIRGRFGSTTCRVQEPFGGDIVVDSSEKRIKSIELQLVRVERIFQNDALK